MKIYISIALDENNKPSIIGVFKTRKSAENTINKYPGKWINIIEKTLEN